jgi:ABC-type branched-subunit amino acid transport system ATPase component/ABC-type branched-subunit amino acid transport system permease subunit
LRLGSARGLLRRGLIALAAVALVAFPLVRRADTYHQTVLLLIFLLAVMSGGWNIISGFTGYVSLGQSAFLGIGAYAVALASLHVHVTPLLLVPLGALAAAAAAAILGAIVMRARGHSFVIITIAFLFLMQTIALNWRSLTHGSNGITLPLPRWNPDLGNMPFYYVMLGLMVLSVILSGWIRRSKFGMGLIAIREDEDKASAIGVRTPVYKVLAFVASAVLIGAAGGVHGYFLTFIDPRGMFDILTSVQIVLAALLGGRGTIWGPVLGAFLLVPMNELTINYFGTSPGERLFVFGLLLGAVVLFLPLGVIPTARRWLERMGRAGESVPLSEPPIRTVVRTVEAAKAGTAKSEGSPLLEVEDLTKRFGGVVAVDRCSLSIPRGSITSLIGPNGSGKTTLFNLVSGMSRPDGGTVRFEGRPLDRSPPWRRAHLGIGRTFQITRLFKQTTVLENVVAPLGRFEWRQLTTDAVSGPEAGRAEELLDFVGMSPFADVVAGQLSFGQQKLVELAQVLMLEPQLILLDEPAGGVNPTLIQRITELIRELNQQGITFVVVEHNMPLVLDLCDPILVLARGRCIAQGSPSTIQGDPAVLDAYLGEGWGRVEQRLEI